MQFNSLVIALAAATGVSAAVANTLPVSETPIVMPAVQDAAYPSSSLVFYNTTVTLEEVVTAFTTVCDPGVVTLGTHTYTLETTSTITITDCPCTVSTVIPTLTSSMCSSSTSTLPIPVVIINEPTISTTTPLPTPVGTGGISVPFSPPPVPTASPTFQPASGAASIAVSGFAVFLAAVLAAL